MHLYMRVRNYLEQCYSMTLYWVTWKLYCVALASILVPLYYSALFVAGTLVMCVLLEYIPIRIY